MLSDFEYLQRVPLLFVTTDLSCSQLPSIQAKKLDAGNFNSGSLLERKLDVRVLVVDSPY